MPAKESIDKLAYHRGRGPFLKNKLLLGTQNLGRLQGLLRHQQSLKLC